MVIKNYLLITTVLSVIGCQKFQCVVKSFLLIIMILYTYIKHFNSFLFSILMKHLFLRNAVDNFVLDLKNFRFRAQFNCFSKDIKEVAFICSKRTAA